MIEYLLILVLTVGLIMALSRGLGRPVQKYLQSNVFDLVGCMMRVGALPHIALSQCQTSSLDIDTSAFKGGSGSSGSVGGSSSSGSKSNPSNSNSSKSSDSSSSSGSDSNVRDSSQNASIDGKGSRGSGNRSSDSFSPGNGFKKDNSNKRKIASGNASGEDGNSELGGFKSDNDNFGEDRVIRIKKKRTQGIGGSFLITDDKIKEKAQQEIAAQGGSSKKASSKEAELQGDKKSNFTIEKGSGRDISSAQDAGEMDFSFMGMIKWVIIIAIIFIFFVFSAMQLNAIRKGWTDG